MHGMPWIKIYTEILDDVKILRLTDAQKWRFISLILFAAECDADGALVMGESLVTLEDVSIRLRCDIEILEKDIEIFTSLVLVRIEDGLIVVTNFSERQGPTQEEKRKKWRQRQRERRERVKRESSVSPPGVSSLEEEKNREEEDSLSVGHLFSIYEQEIGPLTPMISDEIGDWSDNYPDSWIEDAIKIASQMNKRNTRYINGILKNWRSEGRGDKNQSSIESELKRKGYAGR